MYDGLRGIAFLVPRVAYISIMILIFGMVVTGWHGMGDFGMECI